MMKLKLSHYLYVGLLTIMSFGIAMLGDAGRDWFRYAGVDVGSGEIWRMLTGHIAHLSWAHWLSNIGALWVIMLLWGAHLQGRHWWYSSVFMAFSLSVLFYLFEPDLHGYVGLSGVLHGLIVLGLCAELKSGNRGAWLVLVGVAIKLAYEQLYGAMPGSEEMVGGNVMVDAHLYGALLGLVYAGLWHFCADRE